MTDFTKCDITMWWKYCDITLFTLGASRFSLGSILLSGLEERISSRDEAVESCLSTGIGAGTLDCRERKVCQSYILCRKVCYFFRYLILNIGLYQLIKLYKKLCSNTLITCVNVMYCVDRSAAIPYWWY